MGAHETIHPDPVRVLKLDTSGRYTGSVTRALTTSMIEVLRDRLGPIDVIERDLAARSLPYVDETWIAAGMTPAAERSEAERAALAVSDELVAELMAAKILVFGIPLYNFGIPAALKAWVDMVARAQVTFRYTPEGPQGLLHNKKAYLMMASGGVETGSEMDFATGYMRHILGFLGITDVEVVSADQVLFRGETAVTEAEARMRTLSLDLNAA